MDVDEIIKSKKSINLNVRTNAPITEIVSYDQDGDFFKMNVSAIPENNKANIEIIKHFKKKYKLDVSIMSGLTSKKKAIKIKS